MRPVSNGEANQARRPDSLGLSSFVQPVGQRLLQVEGCSSPLSLVARLPLQALARRERGPLGLNTVLSQSCAAITSRCELFRTLVWVNSRCQLVEGRPAAR